SPSPRGPAIAGLDRAHRGPPPGRGGARCGTSAPHRSPRPRTATSSRPRGGRRSPRATTMTKNERSFYFGRKQWRWLPWRDAPFRDLGSARALDQATERRARPTVALGVHLQARHEVMAVPEAVHLVGELLHVEIAAKVALLDGDARGGGDRVDPVSLRRDQR